MKNKILIFLVLLFLIKTPVVLANDWTKVKDLQVGQYIKTIDGWEKITSIELLPPEQVYDISISGTHNFVGNGIVAHNTTVVDLMGDVARVKANFEDYTFNLSAGKLDKWGYADYKIEILNLRGESVGYIEGAVNQGRFMVTDAEIRNEYLGLGLGTRAYSKLIDKIISDGYVFTSGRTVSEEAARVYTSLSKAGYGVTKNPETFVEEGGKLRTWNDKPVFVISKNLNLRENGFSRVDFTLGLAGTTLAGAGAYQYIFAPLGLGINDVYDASQQGGSNSQKVLYLLNNSKLNIPARILTKDTLDVWKDIFEKGGVGSLVQAWFNGRMLSPFSLVNQVLNKDAKTVNQTRDYFRKQSKIDLYIVNDFKEWSKFITPIGDKEQLFLNGVIKYYKGGTPDPVSLSKEQIEQISRVKKDFFNNGFSEKVIARADLIAQIIYLDQNRGSQSKWTKVENLFKMMALLKSVSEDEQIFILDNMTLVPPVEDYEQEIIGSYLKWYRLVSEAGGKPAEIFDRVFDTGLLTIANEMKFADIQKKLLPQIYNENNPQYGYYLFSSHPDYFSNVYAKCLALTSGDDFLALELIRGAALSQLTQPFPDGYTGNNDVDLAKANLSLMKAVNIFEANFSKTPKTFQKIILQSSFFRDYVMNEIDEEDNGGGGYIWSQKLFNQFLGLVPEDKRQVFDFVEATSLRNFFAIHSKDRDGGGEAMELLVESLDLYYQTHKSSLDDGHHSMDRKKIFDEISNLVNNLTVSFVNSDDFYLKTGIKATAVGNDNEAFLVKTENRIEFTANPLETNKNGSDNVFYLPLALTGNADRFYFYPDFFLLVLQNRGRGLFNESFTC